MAGLDNLNDLQRATLQLLLKQGKSYDEIAALLKIDASAVQSRAHEAVAALVPAKPDIGDDRRREVTDYLLGQQAASGRAATREYLEDSADGRSWARSVAGALRPVAGDGLPEIPAEPAEVDQAFEALDKRTARHEEVQRKAQLGSKLLLVALGLLVAVALIIVLGVFDGDDTPKPKTATVTRTAATTPNEQPTVVLQGNLRAPRGSDSPKASAEAAIVTYRQANQFKLLIAGKDMQPAPEGSAYAVWLYSSPTQALFIGFPKGTVSDKGTLEVVADLTPQTPTYREVLLTRERVESPTKPGTIVLRGEIAVPPQAQGTTTTPAPTQTQTTP